MIATPPAAPIPAFALAHPQTTPTLGFSVSLPTESLTERHRPATLADMVGQGAAVFQLETFLEAPVPQAFIFAGPTGVGKTTAARALANDLGVSADWGFHVIKSAEADADAVDAALSMLRHSCPAGSGWKLVLIDEADLMTPKASHLWLSALEDLPPRSVVVFTTNRPEHFPDRFLDRCERIDFAADGDLLWQDAEALVDRIWLAETGRADAPRMTEIPGVVDKHGKLSFRRCVAALDPMIRRAVAAGGAARKPPGGPVAPRSVPFAIPAPAPAPASVARPVVAPAPVPARKHGCKPAPAPKPAERPGPARSVVGTTNVARIDDRLAELEREYERIGETLLAMDLERNALKAERKRLGRRA